MAVIIEDGSLVTGANSYASEAELAAYATARGVTITGDQTELLIRAMDYIESLDFIGLKFSRDQALQWPRVDVWIDSFWIGTSTIPQLLIDGQIEAALAIDNGQDQLADVSAHKDSVTVGPISVTYSNSRSTTLVRKISAKLRKLIRSTGGSFTVNRG